MMMIRKTIIKRMNELNLNPNQLSEMLKGRIPRRTIYDFLSEKTDARTEVASALMKKLGLKLVATKKPKKKRVLTKTDLDEMLHQVRYEHAMLSVAGDYLSGEKIKDGLLKNALLESFLVHARNLIDFFYIDQPKLDDDVLAVDFFTSPNEWIEKRGELPQYLKETKAKANKLLSHITLSRIKKYKKDKGWPVLKIKAKIDKVLECFEKEKTL